jgi:hypothetical protein
VVEGTVRHVSKYKPHQNRRECDRRLRQVRSGALKGPVVTDEARYAAFGFIAPDQLQLVTRFKGA